MSHDRYKRWINYRRNTRPMGQLADRVMAEIQHAPRPVTQLGPQFGSASPLTSLAACCAAFLVGMTPFLYIAYLAKLIAF